MDLFNPPKNAITASQLFTDQCFEDLSEAHENDYASCPRLFDGVYVLCIGDRINPHFRLSDLGLLLFFFLFVFIKPSVSESAVGW